MMNKILIYPITLSVLLISSLAFTDTSTPDQEIFNQGVQYAKEQKFDDALNAFNKAIELNTNLAQAYHNRAIVYYTQRNYTRAKQDALKAQSLGAAVNPDFLKDIEFELNPTTTRYYYNNCNDGAFAKVTKGMSIGEVRALVGGHEFSPFETVRGGFTFAVNEQRSAFFTIPNWMPVGRFQMDFFVFKDHILYIRYDDNKKVVGIALYPIANKII